ncbi:uncharacterized protein M421DRAFT_422134 [Didymella exigua CBS 183.55]|uniref:Uncharacterized protein n=1 Tax=Didymella exigua CBS 183.55 TaxID=1150837 RepID=A0A6A5RF18_9PLEO|nr:uncharacterized protein M421DRAFT_422134 [Didymella exigua CBS 183.55]KAF1926891.1 hypothetical protein M421DRAFT_422134 [Didymella exigua CBS 183.55]
MEGWHLLLEDAALCRRAWRLRILTCYPPAPTHRSFNASTAPKVPTPSKMLFRLGKVNIELNPWNPLYAVAPFIILMVSIPLAILAVITTSIALSLLAFRGFIVYAQLGTVLLGAWLSPSPAKPVAQQHQPPSPERKSQPRNRNRRISSNGSGTSQDTAVPTAHLGPKSGSFTYLLGEGGLTRDYEGVGGWRDTGNEDEEALWMGINSRLQLPAAPTGRRHQRRHTGGQQSPNQRWSWSPEAFRMSPVQSRARTPNRVVAIECDNGDYFPAQPKNGGRPISTASDPLKRHGRRLSGSGSSITSVASSMMAPVKESGE